MEIEFDENASVKITSQLVHCFFFFWDLGLSVATDKFDEILAAADRNNEVRVSVSENVPRAPFQQITMPMNTPTKLHPVEYASLNEKITKVGYLRQSFWPTGILRNIKAMENLASQLFPFDGDICLCCCSLLSNYIT